ncbi:MAG: LuxR C-terminal-related transcriptional regulator [Rudanella sp.]|nr:LuxR C-terminal-related transcriptional regulator [Rudanella sp.]
MAITNAHPSEIVTFFHGLTNQEAFILAYALLGLRSDEIAGKLGITKLTVNTHRRNTMTKWHSTHLTACTGKRAAHEMLATVRPYAADYLPHV